MNIKNVWLSLFLLSSVVSTSEAGTIRLRNEASVSTALISLGDIAELQEFDSVQHEQLSRLTIGPAPAPGKSVKVSLDTIRRELALRGINQTELQFNGGSQVQVTRYQEVSPEKPAPQIHSQQHLKFEQHLQQLLQQHLQQVAPELKNIRCQFSIAQLQQVLLKHPGTTSWSLQGGQQPWIGPQQLTLSGLNSEGALINEVIACQFFQKPQVLALKQGLPRGQIIRAGDLVWVEGEPSENTFSSIDQLIGTETLRSLRSDVPLRRDDVRQMPLVRRNEVVAVSAQIGSITVRRYCRSLEEGTLGQYVILVPVDGKEKISARISGLREAEVVLGTPTAPSAAQPVEKTVAAQQVVLLKQTETPSQIPSTANPVQPASFHSPGQIFPNQPARLTSD